MQEFKITILGKENAGKTSIVQALLGRPNKQHDPTIGGNFHLLGSSTPEYSNCKLCIWDTAGQERYKSLVGMYLRKVDACLIVGDLSEKNYLAHMQEWYQYLEDSKKSEKSENENGELRDPVVWFIGHKSDLCEDVNQKKLELLSKFSNLGIVVITSIQDNKSILNLKNQLFQEMVTFGPQITQNSSIIQNLENDESQTESKFNKCCAMRF